MLQAVGRTPNGKKIAADQAGVAVTDRGFINVDIQMRTNVPHMPVYEAQAGTKVIAGKLQGNKELAASAFNARVIPIQVKKASSPGPPGPCHRQRPHRGLYQAAV